MQDKCSISILLFRSRELVPNTCFYLFHPPKPHQPCSLEKNQAPRNLRHTLESLDPPRTPSLPLASSGTGSSHMPQWSFCNFPGSLRFLSTNTLSSFKVSETIFGPRYVESLAWGYFSVPTPVFPGLLPDVEDKFEVQTGDHRQIHARKAPPHPCLYASDTQREIPLRFSFLASGVPEWGRSTH